MATSNLLVLINPFADKSGDRTEVLVPANIELRNGIVTQNKNWGKRFGYATTYSLGEDSPVSVFINHNNIIYAVLESGNIYRVDTQVKLSRKLRGKQAGEVYKPSVVPFNDIITLWDGGRPIKIEDGDSDYLGGSPPLAKYAARIDSYIFTALGNRIEWCSANNPEVWGGGGDSDFVTVKNDGTDLNGLIANGSYLFAFKAKSCEVWLFTGGDNLIARNNNFSFDVGLLAEASPIVSQKSIMWLGDTRDIYEVTLGSGDPKIVSNIYKKAFDDFNAPATLRGMLFDREYRVRWASDSDEKCFVFDYLNKVWSEDNHWDGNDFKRLPFNCVTYTENNVCYAGSSLPDGKVYEWSEDYTDDDGEAIRVYRSFVVDPFKNTPMNEGVVSLVSLRLKRGVGDATTLNPKLVIRARVDNGKWKYKHVDLGEDWDKKTTISYWLNLFGSEFEFEIIETDMVEFLISSMIIAVEGSVEVG